MENRRTILVCDNDEAVLAQLQSYFQEEGFGVDIISDATELVPRAIRHQPVVVIANPDMPGFNEKDVCKDVMKEMQAPVILLLDRHSTHRTQIDDCEASDVVTKPVDLDILANLVAKHVTVNQ